MAQATAEVILFVDIRPEIAPGAIQRLVSNFADPTVGCANGELIVRTHRGDGTSAVFGGLYWRYEKWARTCESACGSPVGVYGGFYAVRRTLAVLSLPESSSTTCFSRFPSCAKGSASSLIPMLMFTTPGRKQSRESFNARCVLAGNFQLFQVAPWTLTPQNPALFQLVSHKLMRLLAPFLLVALLASTVALLATSPVYATLVALQTLALALAMLGMCFTVPILNRIAAPISALFVLNAAAVVPACTNSCSHAVRSGGYGVPPT